MSRQFARAACERMNMKPSLLAHQFKSTVVLDLQAFAEAEVEVEHAESLRRSDEMMRHFGLNAAEGLDKPFRFSRGLAVIPITGVLINRFGYSWSYVTGYNFVRSQLSAALADPDVKGIIFDVNSPGGECAGCFELSDEIYNSRAIKPSLAIVDSMAYSGGYALASAASKMIVTPSGGVGSIGVVMTHFDMSKMLEKFGIDVTFIFSGDHKVDGNSYEPLPADVKKQFQADVDATRQEFVNLVARNRGIDAKVVYDTQAACYSAADGKQLGLVDAVMPAGKAVSAFLNELAGSQQHETGITTMSKDTENTTQGDSAEARKAERERISAIQTCAEAEGKTKLANHLALNTELSVEDAKAILAASPAEQVAAEPAQQAAADSAFMKAMDADKHPNVGADGGSDQGGSSEMSLAQQVLRDQAIATGRKLH